MQFSLKPDFEISEERYKAFWERDVVDRIPIAGITFPVKNEKEVPHKEYNSYKDMWLDVEFRAEKKDVELSNQVYYADSLPIAWPNMGPGIYSAWCGCAYHYGKITTWTEPALKDWDEDVEKVSLNMQHPLFKAAENFTRVLLERGKNKFIVGVTDFQPGADHLAALRGTTNLLWDLMDNPEKVKGFLKKSLQEYFVAYDHYYSVLKKAEIPITAWIPLIHDGRYCVVQNDFSAMVGPEMFEEFFLEEIIECCRFYDKSIYHLDGPDALRHLDILLDIKELDAIQWQPGINRHGFSKWIDVYKKIQKAKKGMQILKMNVNELDLLFKHLRPEGVFIDKIVGINDKETADYVLTRIKNWK